MLGSLISAGTQFIGGLLGARAARKAEKRANAREDTAIQRRVKDSLAAGVHPLFGLGASVSSSQPVVAGQVGDALRESGQDIGRAVDAYRSQSEREVAKAAQALQLRRMGLENRLIETQIRSENHRMVGSPPAFPETLARVAQSVRTGKLPGQGSGSKRVVMPGVGDEMVSVELPKGMSTAGEATDVVGEGADVPYGLMLLKKYMAHYERLVGENRPNGLFFVKRRRPPSLTAGGRAYSRFRR